MTERIKEVTRSGLAIGPPVPHRPGARRQARQLGLDDWCCDDEDMPWPLRRTFAPLNGIHNSSWHESSLPLSGVSAH